MALEKCRVVVHRQVAIQEVSEGAVLVDLGSGACFELNRVGVEVWKALSAGQTLNEVIQVLSARYDVGLDVLAADVATLTKSLSDSGLIDVLEDEGAQTS
jgi:hypothetical protein